MRFLSMFSGIDAASVAWGPLGWKAAAFCEIEKFPSAVLAHHYPDTPNLGDVTKADFDAIGPIDLAVFGSPCQSFSVAGLRLGLDDARGNLALLAGRIVYRKRPRWFVFENVPGLLSSDDGWDFGTLLAAYAGYPSGSVFKPPADGWGSAGVVIQADGQSYGLAWRVLDAQYFGVAQRRRRVFVVGYLGDWRRAAAVLFERHSLSGHPAPRRKTGKAAPTIPSRSSAGGGLGTDFDCDGGLIAGTLNSGGKAAGSATQQDAESGLLVAHTLKGEGFDASEDGTGRGTPIVPVHAIQERAVSENTNAGPQGAGHQEGVAYTLEARNKVQAVAYRTTGNDGCYKTGDHVGALTHSTDANAQIIAFSAKDHGADAMTDLSPTLRAGGHSKSHANAGVMPAIAFSGQMSTPSWSHNVCDTLQAKNPRAVAFSIMPMNSGKDFKGRETDVAQPVMAAGPAGGNQGGDYIVQSAARRLTPRECERLQGFPDDYTAIPYRKGLAADGPRYKALGNSMAVPVMAHIGRRIQAVDAIRNIQELAA